MLTEVEAGHSVTVNANIVIGDDFEFGEDISEEEAVALLSEFEREYQDPTEELAAVSSDGSTVENHEPSQLITSEITSKSTENTPSVDSF